MKKTWIALLLALCMMTALGAASACCTSPSGMDEAQTMEETCPCMMDGKGADGCPCMDGKSCVKDGMCGEGCMCMDGKSCVKDGMCGEGCMCMDGKSCVKDGMCGEDCMCMDGKFCMKDGARMEGCMCEKQCACVCGYEKKLEMLEAEMIAVFEKNMDLWNKFFGMMDKQPDMDMSYADYLTAQLEMMQEKFTEEEYELLMQDIETIRELDEEIAMLEEMLMQEESAAEESDVTDGMKQDMDKKDSNGK